MRAQGSWGLAGLGRVLGSIKDAVFPPGCAVCSRPIGEDQTFCQDCLSQLILIEPPYCRICGRPMFGLGDYCKLCQEEVPAFDQARSLGLHTGSLAEAVRALKYQGRLAAGNALAAFWAQEVPVTWLAGADIMTPVPLHPLRLMKRGFNQALVLAAELYGPRLIPRLLVRTRHTRPQVGLSRQERRSNVAHAFSVKSGQEGAVRGRRVILLDDVYTTGATVDECARVLKEAGAAQVRVLTLSRAMGRAPGPEPRHLAKIDFTDLETEL